jgi:hypothetical protein
VSVYGGPEAEHILIFFLKIFLICVNQTNETEILTNHIIKFIFNQYIELKKCNFLNLRPKVMKSKFSYNQGFPDDECI